MRLSLREIEKAVKGRLIGNDLTVRGVSTDSRKMGEDFLFVPIIGERFDAHDFIAEAVQNGAAAFVSDREAADAKTPYVLVSETKRALMDLAAYYRSLFNIPVVAVTGSVGKTSVKNGIAAVLGQRYNVLKTEGNLNNEIGLPLTVFKLCGEHQAAVFEMGMNSFGEISNLSKIAKPDIAVITNVGTAHIERLGDREGILSAKLEIVDGMSEKGIIVINKDNDLLRTIGNRIEQRVFEASTEEEADVYVNNITSTCYGGFKIRIIHGDVDIDAEIPFSEPQLIMNILMSTSVGLLLGLTKDEIKKGLVTDTSEKGRLERCKAKRGAIIINDCYNANPESMRLALDILSKSDGNKVAVLGDMLEQGGYAKGFHTDIGRYVYKSGASLVAIGTDARYYKEGFDELKAYYGGERQSRHFENKNDFFAYDISFGDDTTVLLKASRGMKFEEILEYLIGCGE